MWTASETCRSGSETCIEGTEDFGSGALSVGWCVLDPLEECGDDDDDFLAACRGDQMVICNGSAGYMEGDECLDGCSLTSDDTIDCDVAF